MREAHKAFEIMDGYRYSAFYLLCSCGGKMPPRHRHLGGVTVFPNSKDYLCKVKDSRLKSVEIRSRTA